MLINCSLNVLIALLVPTRLAKATLRVVPVLVVSSRLVERVDVVLVPQAEHQAARWRRILVAIALLASTPRTEPPSAPPVLLGGTPALKHSQCVFRVPLAPSLPLVPPHAQLVLWASTPSGREAWPAQTAQLVFTAVLLEEDRAQHVRRVPTHQVRVLQLAPSVPQERYLLL